MSRIQAICNFIPKGVKCVADIGCDHGLVAKNIIDERLAEKVIATDISEKSLLKTKNMVLKYNYGHIETRVGDGLEPIEKNEVDVCVIAGIGGRNIISILKNKNRKDLCKKFILVPHQNQSELRRWLSENNYKIIKEQTLIENDKFYDIMLVDVGSQKLSDFQVYFGTNNKKDVDFLRKVSFLIEKYTQKLKFKNATDGLLNAVGEALKIVGE